MSNGNSGMIMVMSMMMSIAASVFLVPISLAIFVWLYRKYGTNDEILTGDPESVNDRCVVLMNNTPEDNPNGKTRNVCLSEGETSRQVDLKREMKELHDEVSAVRVGKGVYLDLYEHTDYGGGYLRIDGDALRASQVVNLTSKCITDDGTGTCSDGKPDWNDNVSSFQIVRKDA